MKNSDNNKVLNKYNYLLSVANERLNNPIKQLGEKDFSVQFKLLKYVEAENEKKIENQQIEIDALKAENIKLIELHHLGKILARRAGRLPFSIYFRVKKKYRRILRAFRNSTVGGASQNFHENESLAYEQKTNEICQRFGLTELDNITKPLHSLVGSNEIVKSLFENVPVSSRTSDISALNFSIITPFFKHKDFFCKCAESVNALFQFQVHSNAEKIPEWIIVNDDPRFSEKDLFALIPAELHPHVRILSNGRNVGISAALNKGIRSAKNPWVMLLDCDDMIEPHAISVLTKAIKTNPGIRYFSSEMIDIDESGVELRRRKRHSSPINIFEAGMTVGHLVTFSVEMFEDYGGFNEHFSGVQDYDLALRVSAKEKLGHIPDHLYRYRWHGNSVSVSARQRQTRLTYKVRSDFFRNEFNIERKPAVSKNLQREIPTALCIIRTQGKRMELLISAIESVRAQSIAMTPCIVVHGDVETRDFVERNLPDAIKNGLGGSLVVISATEPGKRRGYPCNVGLQYLKEHASEYDFLCFLDDDDHLLPQFGSQLATTVKMSNADFAYGMTNALPPVGDPFIQHNLLPAVTLFVGNFLPINSYLLKTEIVVNFDLKFNENVDYLEDWDFLMQVMACGAKGVPLFEVVSEYRLIGDGNTNNKKDQKHFNECRNKVISRGETCGRKNPASQFWAEILDFPSDRRDDFNANELARLNMTRNLFKPLVMK